MQKVLGLHPTRSLYIGKHNASAEQMDKAVRLGKSNNLTTQQYKDGLYDVVREERKALKDGNRALNKHKRLWAK